MDMAAIAPPPASPPPAGGTPDAAAPDNSTDFAQTLAQEVTRSNAQEPASQESGASASAGHEDTPARSERVQRPAAAPLEVARDDRIARTPIRPDRRDGTERSDDARHRKRVADTDALPLAAAPAINAPVAPVPGDGTQRCEPVAHDTQDAKALGPLAQHTAAARTSAGGSDAAAALRAAPQQADGARTKEAPLSFDAPATVLHSVEQASAYVAAASGAAHEAPNAPPADVPVPVGAPGWDRALSDHVVVLAKDGRHVAQLHLDPPDLGPLDVRLTVGAADGTASAHFASAHAAVREAVEAAIPRLREAYAQSGLALATVTVSTGFRDPATQQQGPDAGNAPYTRAASDAPRTAAVTSIPATGIRVRRGLVDTFA